MLKTDVHISAFCSRPFKRLKFTPEGDVTFCCFQERKCLGNILKTDLKDIWFSPLADAVRRETLQNNLHRTCKIHSCPFFHNKVQIPEEFFAKSFPSEFEIDLPSQHCNIGGENPNIKNPACIMCERHLRNAKDFYQEDKLEEVCRKLRPYMQHIKWLHIQGVAEPFWKDRIFDILEYLDLKNNKEKIYISTTTNGTLMNERHRKMFLEYPNSTIVWSLDAGSREIYKVIRRVDMYNVILNNLKNFIKEKRFSNRVHIHNNINVINIEDVDKMMLTAHDLGVDQIDFNATYGIPSICVNKENVGIFKEAQIRIMALSRKLNVFTTFMRNLTLDLVAPPSEQEITDEMLKLDEEYFKSLRAEMAELV
jgi:MoaA/NifB/PqqE/SkfB family radical SAM enzyme